MADSGLAQGFYYYQPSPNAPEYIIANISLDKRRALEWLEAQEPNEKGFIALVVKRSENGKLYFSLDTRRQQQRTAPPSRPAPPQRPAPPARRDDWADPHSNTGYYPGPDGKPLPDEDGDDGSIPF